MKTSVTLVLAVAASLLAAKVLLAKPDEAEKARAREKIKAGALVIDVRTPDEFSSGHHPAATNIPVQELKARLGELGGDTNRAVVVYCRSGNRSTTAKKILLEAGFRDVTNGGAVGDVMKE